MQELYEQALDCDISPEKEQDTPHPWDYYDELFAEDKIKYEKQKEQKAFEDYKEKRRLYVEAFNKRRRQGT